MTHLFWLSDEAWSAIEPHLPRGKPGKPRVDDRTVISGILHVLKIGCRWRDVPSEYGLIGMIEARIRAVNLVDLDERLRALEER